MNFLAAIPFKKEIIIVILAALAVYIFSQMRYNSGVEEIEAKYTKLNYEGQLADMSAKLEAEKANIKVTTEVVTVYKDRVIEIEKKVPVYVTKVKEIFGTGDSVIIPPALARLHNVSAEGGDADAFSTGHPNDATARPVTLGEFATRVVENYGVCAANTEQLKSLQTWIVSMQKVYSTKK